MRRIDLPLPLLLAWMALTVVLMVQGMRLASEHQTRFEPSRPATLRAGAELELGATERALIYLGGHDARLAVYQELPERELLRWSEPALSTGEALLVPLEGLEPGDYVLAEAPGAIGAADQEMDRPEQSLTVLARFRLLPD